MSVVAQALAVLRAGGLVVVPTETVYGVAALPGARGAIEALFAAKGRPADKAIPVLGASVPDLAAVVRFDERARRVAAAYWPGPLTLVLPRAEDFTYDLGGAEVVTVAVRVPDAALTRELLEASGPLAVTSANRSGRPPAVTAADARRELGDAAAFYVDAGPCELGSASTILSLAGEPRVLRRGAIPERELRQVVTE